MVMQKGDQTIHVIKLIKKRIKKRKTNFTYKNKHNKMIKNMSYA